MSGAVVLGIFLAAVVSFGFSGAHVVTSGVLGFHVLLCVSQHLHKRILVHLLLGWLVCS